MDTNLQLNDTFQGIGNAMQNIGAITQQVRKSRKAVNVSKYHNVTQGQPQANPTPAPTPLPEGPQAPQSSFTPLPGQPQQPTIPTVPQNIPPAGLLNRGTITTPYGSSTRYEPFHPGVDIASGMNKPVVSEEPGTVIGVTTGKKQGNAGFGNSVVVQDSYGNKYRYSHLNQSWVKVGDKLTRGSAIGAQGNSGSTYSTSGGSGEHLDLRIKNAYNQYVNPITFLKTFHPNQNG